MHVETVWSMAVFFLKTPVLMPFNDIFTTHNQYPVADWQLTSLTSVLSPRNPSWSLKSFQQSEFPSNGMTPVILPVGSKFDVVLLRNSMLFKKGTELFIWYLVTAFKTQASAYLQHSFPMPIFASHTELAVSMLC